MVGVWEEWGSPKVFVEDANIYTIAKNIRAHKPMWENLILVEHLCLADVIKAHKPMHEI